MLKLILLVVYVGVELSVEINVTCNSDSNCLNNNSVCQNHYCRCNNIFILDCETEAAYLVDSYQTINVTNEIIYFQTQKQKPNIYYSLVFQLCQQDVTVPDYQFVFQIWVNTGQPTLNDKNFAGDLFYPLSKLSQLEQCVEFVEYQGELQTQPNGQTQNIIIGLSIQPIKNTSYCENCTAIIQMKVTTTVLFSSDLVIKLAIGIICAIVIFCLTVILFCCYRKWKRRRQAETQHKDKQRMLQQFKKYIPEVQVKNLHLPKMSSCSICLGEFEGEQNVRKIVCNHVFHSDCIDEWCVKNLTCPVCRLGLSIDQMQSKKKEMKNSEYEWHDVNLSISVKDELLESTIKG